jgi:drug/metabolite transporter (DMT)-like permease
VASLSFQTLALTSLAMLAFASNSILCRLALVDGSIDAASFTSIRLVSGAVMLLIIVAIVTRRKAAPQPPPGAPIKRGSWISAAMLFLYAICFSFAYGWLTASTGALILFGTVQLTMLLVGVREGDRPSAVSWIGFAIAAGGLIYLLSPGLEAPPPLGAALMAIAGVAWGIYSLRGRGAGDPLRLTADNFALSVPMTLVASAIFISSLDITSQGVLLAVTSGAITSGLGYVVWYAVLPKLGATRAAVVQLSGPVLTAFGGVLLLSEMITARLVIATVAILGGIALALRFHRN